MEHNAFTCPNCGSDNTMMMSMVYANGHATGKMMNYEVVGYNVEHETVTRSDGSTETKEVGRSPVYGNVSRPAHMTSDLAKMVAPPEKPVFKPVDNDNWFIGCGSIGCLFPIIGLIGTMIAYHEIPDKAQADSVMNVVGYIFLAALFLFLMMNRRKTKNKNKKIKEQYDRDMEEYNRALEEWRHYCICMRCGYRFRIND